MAGAMKLAAVAQKTVFLPKEKARPSLGERRLLSHSQGPCGPAKLRAGSSTVQQVQARRSPEERGAAKSLEERAEEISHGSTCRN